MSDTINNLFSLMVIGGQIFLLFSLLFLASGAFKRHKVIGEFIGKRGILLAFFVFFGAFMGSLYYSNIAGFEPCPLCWWQRIFIYPQVALLGIALVKKESAIIDYSLTLSAIGASISAYHEYLGYGGIPFIPCLSEAVSCAKRYVFEFGYITIPVMALTAFLVGIALLLWQKSYERQSSHVQDEIHR